ncbi:recombinase family protein [Paracoccus sp. (in: a-proteobacteria)]|uniref:recombinase family protein n=1 Tax=Paracoccus sp. TaxID=267 RepID=UPI0028B09D2D|nr:recombinase family protein [Paracoccus sp. (in: a-proteobacteria)]
MEFHISDTIQASCLLDRNEALPRTRRAASHGPTVITVENLGQLGRRPTEIMERISRLRRAGAQIVFATGKTSRDGYGQFVRELLAALSTLERLETTRATREAIQIGRARGSSAGRPRVMTPERQAIAARMLLQGQRGPQILKVIRGLEGPAVSRSAYYLWQKARLTEGQNATRRL